MYEPVVMLCIEGLINENICEIEFMKDKVIIITGAASGIGAETAKLLANEGAKLVVADIHEEALLRCVTGLRAIHDDVVAVPIDVSIRDSWESVVHAAINAFEKIDILINCAGIACPDPHAVIPEESMRRHIDVNLTGAMLGTHVMLRYFLRQERGHIIHIASLAALAPLPNEAAYTASKFGLRGFCLAVDLELRKSPVNISIICPDAVNTPMLVHEAMNGVSSLVFSGTVLQPETITRAVYKTILKPRREVLVPGYRGWLCKLACVAPGLLSLLFPIMDRLGKRNLEKYIRRFKEKEITNTMEGIIK